MTWPGVARCIDQPHALGLFARQSAGRQSRPRDGSRPSGRRSGRAVGVARPRPLRALVQDEHQRPVGHESRRMPKRYNSRTRRCRGHPRRPDRPARSRGSGRTAPICHRVSAGRMVFSTWSARAAANSKRFGSGDQRDHRLTSRSARIASAPSLPPGSRVTTQSMPRSSTQPGAPSAGSTCRPLPRLRA